MPLEKREKKTQKIINGKDVDHEVFQKVDLGFLFLFPSLVVSFIHILSVSYDMRSLNKKNRK